MNTLNHVMFLILLVFLVNIPVPWSEICDMHALLMWGVKMIMRFWLCFQKKSTRLFSFITNLLLIWHYCLTQCTSDRWLWIVCKLAPWKCLSEKAWIMHCRHYKPSLVCITFPLFLFMMSQPWSLLRWLCCTHIPKCIVCNYIFLFPW